MIREGNGSGRLPVSLLIILVAAAVLRLINLPGLSLSNDELSALSRLRLGSFSEFLSDGLGIDGHPAGVQVFLYLWTNIFGDDAFVVRLPFVISSVITVYLIYLLGRKWYSEEAGLFSAAAYAFLSFFILYGQFARMYSPGTMFCVLTILAWTNYLESTEDKTNRWWIIWVIGMTAAMHIHYFSFLLVAMVGLSGLFFVQKDKRGKYLMGGFIAVLLFIPEIPLLMRLLDVGNIGGWLGAPGMNFILLYIAEMFNFSPLLMVMILVLMMTGLVSRKFPHGMRWRILSIVWFVLLYAIAYLYSVKISPVLQNSTLMFVFPLFLLFLFSFAPVMKTQRRTAMVLMFLAIGIFDTVAIYRHYERGHFGVFKELAEDIRQWQNEKKVRIPVVANVMNSYYLGYYFNKSGTDAELIGPVGRAELISLSELIDTIQADHISYVWSNAPHMEEIKQVIVTRFPVLTEKNIYFNSASYLYSKTGVTKENILWSRRNEEVALMSDREFSQAVTEKAGNLPGEGYRIVNAAVVINVVDSISDASIVISFDRNGSPFNYTDAKLKDFMLKPGNNSVWFSSPVPSDVKDADEMKVYLWNPAKENFSVTRLEVKVTLEDYPYNRFTR